MKKFIYIMAAAMLALMGCSEETITYTNPKPGDEPSGVKAELGISSKNTWFTTEDNKNAAIGFKSAGGEVVVNISTNVDWDYKTVNGDWLVIEKDDKAAQLILNCESNKAEEKQQATVTITAGDKTATIAVSQNAYGTLEISASENNFTVPARGELIAKFTVTSSDEDWVIETKACPWMLVEREGNDVTITLAENDTFTDRETTFTLIAGEGGGNPVTETISVAQDRAAYVTPSLKTVPFSSTPVKSKEIAIDSNFEWDFSVSDNSNWLSVEKTEDGLTISTGTNPDAGSRSATITLKAGDGKANMAEVVITVSQSGFDFDAFIIGLEVSSKDLRACLPFDKAINATIDWGDGTVEETTEAYPKHTYTDPDYYVVSVKGTVPSINCTGANQTSYNQIYQYKEVFNWGRTGLKSVANAFNGCSYLERIVTDQTEAFTDITDFSKAFYGCTVLEEIPAGLLDNATGLTSLEYTFYNCKSVEKLPKDLLKNNTKLKSVNNAFANTALSEVDENLLASCPELEDCSSLFTATQLKTVPEKLFANNPEINTFNALFSSATEFTTVPAKLFANNPKVTSFRMAFYSTKLEEVPAGLFEGKSECTSFDQTFSKTKITRIDKDTFKGCSKIATFNNCFGGCTELTSIPAELFTASGAFETLTTDKAFRYVFNGCSGLLEVPAGLFDGFSKATTFDNVFGGCESLTTVPENLFATNTAASSFSSAFQNCKSLRKIPNGMLSGLEKVKNFSSLFSGCESLEEIGSGIIDGCSSLTGISSMFKGCKKLTKIAPDAFRGAPGITTIAGLFDGCESLEEVPEELFASFPALTAASSVFANSGIKRVSATLFSRNPNITSFSKIFNLCPRLTEVPDGLFAANTKVTDFTYAFAGCAELVTVGKVFGTSTASVKFSYVFNACPKLATVPEGIFDGQTGATMFDYAFTNCEGLQTIPAGLFAKNTKVTTYGFCFQNCTSLKSVPAQLFSSPGVNNTTAKTFTSLFNGCSSIETIDPTAFVGVRAASATFANLFLNCTSLRSVPDGLFKDNETVSNYSSIFSGCASLETVGTEVFNSTKNTSFTNTFANCVSLKTIGEKPFFAVSKVTSISSIFNGCSSLTRIPDSVFEDFTGLKIVGNAFNNCSSLTGESPVATGKDGVKYHLYERTAETADASGFVAITSSKGCFAGCTGLSDYEQIPAVWK